MLSRYQLQKGNGIHNGNPAEGFQVSEVVAAGNNEAGVAFHCTRKVDVAGGVIYDLGNAQYPGGYCLAEMRRFGAKIVSKTNAGSSDRNEPNFRSYFGHFLPFFRSVRKKGPLPRKGPLIFGGFWTKWSGREDLNLRPLAPQASALTRLRHVPTNIQITIGAGGSQVQRPAR